MGNRPRESEIIRYAEAIVRRGYPPGILAIDDGWQEYIGGWRFHSTRFADPAGLVCRLHELGFKVLLWVVPYVSPDSEEYRDLNRRGAKRDRSKM